LALKMKAEVREMLAAGYDQDQILAYFERSYGEFVRLKPQLRGVNWLVWIAPLLGLFLGGAVVAWALRAPKTPSPVAPAESTPAPAGLSEPDALPSDPKLAAYVLKARELAYGWPGGVRPEEKS
jgi:cytochrome c-type biogenesis protein CcmH